MQCRHCGTEIADKAIVCYRCGMGTTEPVRKAVPIKPRRSPLTSYVVAAVLLLLALYMGYTAPATTDPSLWQKAAGVLAGAALMVIVLAVMRRR
jgi:peptidoglycan/LPS O-acetylase OafA/YrhL